MLLFSFKVCCYSTTIWPIGVIGVTFLPSFGAVAVTVLETQMLLGQKENQKKNPSRHIGVPAASFLGLKMQPH